MPDGIQITYLFLITKAVLGSSMWVVVCGYLSLIFIEFELGDCLTRRPA